MGLFGVSNAKHQEALDEIKALKVKMSLMCSECLGSKITLKDECGLMLMKINNVSFDIDPDIRERVRNLTMIASRALDVLDCTGRTRELNRLKEYYFKAILDVITFSGRDASKKITIIDAINSTENLLFDYINSYNEFKQINAIASLNAAQADLRTQVPNIYGIRLLDANRK